jgi:hypothetical protein
MLLYLRKSFTCESTVLMPVYATLTMMFGLSLRQHSLPSPTFSPLVYLTKNSAVLSIPYGTAWQREGTIWEVVPEQSWICWVR